MYNLSVVEMKKMGREMKVHETGHDVMVMMKVGRLFLHCYGDSGEVNFVIEIVVLQLLFIDDPSIDLHDRDFPIKIIRYLNFLHFCYLIAAFRLFCTLRPSP